MAESRTLQLLLTLKDQASKDLNKLSGTLKNNKKAFKKMSVVGVAGLTAITVGIGKAVKDAGEMEGAMAKFNTVFGDGKEEMLDFVNSLRKEMPTATRDIVKMASGVQDLLVPMGVSRENAQGMTKDFLDLSNKISAFNDVNPEQVLNAIKSGLVGSSEPLKQYGIDARITTLEVVALNEGLLQEGQTLNDLDPAMRTQIQAQALLAQITNQSSDAIEGFTENQDSFIRRQQELQATMKDVSETIGTVFLPIIDDLLKKLLPVIAKVSEWVQENPKLTKVIIIATASLFGLLTVLGLIGLALPPIIAGFALLSWPVLAVIVAVGALIAIGVLLVKNWDKIRQGASNIWNGIKTVISGVIDSIKDGIKAMINYVIDKLNWFVRKANSIQRGINSVPGINIPLIPQIPRLAKGGIVNKPTIAMIGEAGPEAVVPLNKSNASGIGGGLTINVYGDITGEDLINRVGEVLMGDLRMNQKLSF
jgi:phage-related minor tail protein